MKKNLVLTGGLIFSGQLLLDLAEAGMLREDAYRLVQSHAMRSWKEDRVFRDDVSQLIRRLQQAPERREDSPTPSTTPVNSATWTPYL